MSLANIRGALIKGLLDADIDLPMAFENRPFTADKAAAWAAVFVLPNQPDVATLGDTGEDEHTGIMQVNLNYPAGQGDADILATCDTLRAYFHAGKNITYNAQPVTIRSCGRSVGRVVDGQYQIIMSINWYARTARGV